MSIFDRIVDGLKGQIELRGDMSHLAASVDEVRSLLREQDARTRDHDRRLVRLETLVEFAQRGDFGRRRLPEG